MLFMSVADSNQRQLMSTTSSRAKKLLASVGFPAKEVSLNQDSPDINKLTILVVDDHHLIRGGTVGTVQEYFTEARLLSAQTSREALSIISMSVPDVVIVDLSLPERPGMNANVETGIALLKQLMQQYPTLNLMVQSSYVKALVRIKHEIDNHQGGFTVADKSLCAREMLNRLEWAIEGITHTKELATDLEIKPEWFEVLQLAFAEGLQDKAIARKMYKSERMIRHYWTKIQDVLQVYPEEGQNIRALTQIQAREQGLID